MGAGAQPQPVDGHFDELPRFLVERAGGADLAVGHAGVEQRFVSGEAIFLNIAGMFDPGLDGGGRLARFPCRQIAVADGGNLDMDVDPVEKGAGDPALILADLLGRAAAGAAPVAEVTAGTGIHRCNEHEAGGIGGREGGTGDRDPAVFHRLAQRLEGVLPEFRQLVEEEDPVMGEADLPRPRGMAAADQAGVGDRMVRGAKGPGPQERLLPVQQAGDGEYLRRFDGLREGKVGDDRHEPLCEHGLPGSGRTDHEEVVPPRGGDLQGAFGLFLAADLAEIEGIVAAPAEKFPEIDMDRRDLRPAAEKLHHFGELSHRDHLNPLHQRRFGGVFPRDDYPPDAEGLRLKGRGEGAVDPLHAAVQRKFAEKEIVGQRTGGHKTLGGQDCHGDGKIEGGALLFDIGGGQVDGDVMAGEGVPGVLDGGLDPVLALPHGHVGEADRRKQGETGGEIDLDHDGIGINADDGTADGLDDQA